MSAAFIPTSEVSNQTGENIDYAPPLDLQRELIPRPASTFLLVSDTHKDAVAPGDILVVDRSLTPTKGQWVIAEQEGDLCLRQSPVSTVWGVVTYIIHKT
jgi:DNA polymerase V